MTEKQQLEIFLEKYPSFKQYPKKLIKKLIKLYPQYVTWVWKERQIINEYKKSKKINKTR